MRTFKIYSLRPNSQTYNTVLLTIVTMLDVIVPGLIYFRTGNLYLLTTFTHFAHSFLRDSNILFGEVQHRIRKERSIKRQIKGQNTTKWGHNSFLYYLFA